MRRRKEQPVHPRVKLAKKKIERAVEALSKSLEDPTIRELKATSGARSSKRLHLRERVPVSFHMAPKMFAYLADWCRKYNISRSWYILRCVTEGLVRDAGLSADALRFLDLDINDTRDRPKEPHKRKARRTEATKFIREKRITREAIEDPMAWLRRL